MNDCGGRPHPKKDLLRPDNGMFDPELHYLYACFWGFTPGSPVSSHLQKFAGRQTGHKLLVSVKFCA